MGQFLSNVSNTTGLGGALNTLAPTISGIGGQAQGIAESFTPQNTFNVPVGQSTAAIQGNQQALAAALLAQSQGQGPNPVQSALRQQTNQNIQQNAGFVASQKGINPALAVRSAAENQGALSQESAAQAATLEGQQQLAAQGQVANIYNQEQQGTNAADTINAGVASGNAAADQKSAGGLLNGIGSALGLAHGGVVKNYAKGGKVPPHLKLVQAIYHPESMKDTAELKSNGGSVPGKAKVTGDSPKNDTVPTRLSPGEIVLPRSVTESKDPAAEAAKFVADHIKKQKTGKGSPEDFKAALKKAVGSRKGA